MRRTSRETILYIFPLYFFKSEISYLLVVPVSWKFLGGKSSFKNEKAANGFPSFYFVLFENEVLDFIPIKSVVIIIISLL